METHGARGFMEEELNYIAKVLEIDSKNYHAWSYRQWILMTVDEESAWEQELEFGKYCCRRELSSHSKTHAYPFILSKMRLLVYW